MKAQKTIATVLFFISVVLWPVMIYLIFFLPSKVAVWDDQGVILPRATVFLIDASHFCARFGLILLPLLFLVTIGAPTWFVMVSRSRAKR